MSNFCCFGIIMATYSIMSSSSRREARFFNYLGVPLGLVLGLIAWAIFVLFIRSCSVFLCYILSFCILLPSHMGALWVRYVSPMGSIWVPSGSHGCHGPWVLRVPMGYHGFPWEICIVKQFLMKSYQNLSKTHSKYLCYDKKQKFCPHPMLTSIWPGWAASVKLIFWLSSTAGFGTNVSGNPIHRCVPRTYRTATPWLFLSPFSRCTCFRTFCFCYVIDIYS